MTDDIFKIRITTPNGIAVFFADNLTKAHIIARKECLLRGLNKYQIERSQTTEVIAQMYKDADYWSKD
jgi:hypothetical protein